MSWFACIARIHSIHSFMPCHVVGVEPIRAYHNNHTASKPLAAASCPTTFVKDDIQHKHHSRILPQQLVPNWRIHTCIHWSYIMSLILPGLILASFEESFDRRLLAQHHVTHVLNVATECEVSERVGLVYAKHGVPDDCPTSDITSVLAPCMEFIHAARASGGCVVVHCLEGVSRSACVVFCYLVMHAGLCPQQAWEHIQCCRSCVGPWPRYIEQAQAYCGAAISENTM